MLMVAVVEIDKDHTQPYTHTPTHLHTHTPTYSTYKPHNYAPRTYIVNRELVGRNLVLDEELHEGLCELHLRTRG